MKSLLKLALGPLAALGLIIVGYASFQAVSLGSSWASVNRVALDTTSTSASTTATTTAWDGGALPGLPRADRSAATADSSVSTSPPSTTTSTTLPGRQLLDAATSAPSVIALVGSDSRAGLEQSGDFGDFPGRRADVIVLAIREGDRLSLLSVPRDLYVADLCNGGRHRISEALQGCGDTGGLAHLVHELESLTGLDIEHVAAVDLAGFQDVIDTIGGYEICTEYPMRDRKSGLALDAGCTMADGETTLAWLRSRFTERLVDGTWERVPSVSDLTRNTRQRKFLKDIFARIVDRNDPRAIMGVIKTVAPYLTIDDRLSLTDAAAWLWDYRTSEVGTAEIPVAYSTTERGASVLVPKVDVGGFVAGIPS